MNRSKKLIATATSSIILQIVTFVAGFILPYLYLTYWGSEKNGLISSITQFLGLIAFLDLGIGQVVQTALYKPLYDSNNSEISKVVSTGKHFFRVIAYIFAGYCVVLACIYPLLFAQNYDYFYVLTLVLILSIDSFAQYYFGVNYQILLNADQRGYVQNSIYCATIIVNLVICTILVTAGFDIHTVKLASAILYLLRPLLMWLYIKRNYKLVSFKEHPNPELLKQKWDGFAQHISSIVLNNTDVIVLTFLSTLTNVSIYSVYNMVVGGVKSLVTSAFGGVQAVLGEMVAKNDRDELNSYFHQFEWLYHTITTIIFTCTARLIIPFVQVYTKDVNDANYYVPVFAIIITIAHALHSIRLPYNMLVFAGGYYKQTKNCFIISALINIIVSVVTVSSYGLPGVAIGTLVAMLIQTLWLVVFANKYIIEGASKTFAKMLMTDVLVFVIGFLITSILNLDSLTYFSWFVMAVISFAIILSTSFLVNILLNNQMLLKSIKKIVTRYRK